MRIFLTGQEGFIGRALSKLAVKNGHEVLGLERPFCMENPSWDAIASFSPDTCIHAAWIATPGEYTASPLNALHRRWSADLIRGLAKSGIDHVVVLGTCAEYAPSDSPLLEEGSPLSPSNLYAREKAALHNDLVRMERELGFTHSWARIFYPYGPSEHPQRLISSLIRGWETGKPLHLNNPQCVRDYIHLEDVATALLFIAEQQLVGAVNVGTGTGVRLGEMDSLIRERMGIPRESSVSLTDSSGLNDSVVADIKKLKSLGWNSQYDIRSGIDSFFNGSNR